MREALKLSPREEEQIAEIREIMEAKLVWFLMSYDDLEIELVEGTDGWGMPYFTYYLTAHFQKIEAVSVYIKQVYWMSIEFEIMVNINKRRTMRYDRVEGVRKFIMEELT